MLFIIGYDMIYITKAGEFIFHDQLFLKYGGVHGGWGWGQGIGGGGL